MSSYASSVSSKNEEIISEDAKVEEVVEQPDGLPIDVKLRVKRLLRIDPKMISMQT